MVTIRHASIQDAHDIVEAERLIAQVPGIFCSLPHELVVENVVNTINAFQSNNNGVYLVAEENGQLVGHAFLEISPLSNLRHVAELNIAVHKGWQRQGIGTLLLTHLIEWALNTKYLEKIMLRVRATNLAAISLYKKMGFQEEGGLKQRLKIAGNYIDDIIMTLDLQSSSK